MTLNKEVSLADIIKIILLILAIAGYAAKTEARFEHLNSATDQNAKDIQVAAQNLKDTIQYGGLII